MTGRNCVFKPTIVLTLMSTVLLFNSYAAPPLMEGTLNIQGTSVTKSFDVEVSYKLLEGATPTDNWQLEMILDHVGFYGGLPAVDIGRLNVFAPIGTGADGHQDFYLDIDATGSGVAPTQGDPLYGLPAYELTPYITDMTDPNTSSNRGHFYFQDDFFNGSFGENDGITQTLVLEMAPLTNEVDIILEIDYTYSSPQFDGYNELHLIPEPTTIALLGLGLLSFRRKRRINYIGLV